MKRVCFNDRWHTAPTQSNLMEPAQKILLTTPPLRSKSNKPLIMTADDILNILVYYHLNEFSSGREFLQNLEEDEYARHLIAPAGGVKRSTFFDTVNEQTHAPDSPGRTAPCCRLVSLFRHQSDSRRSKWQADRDSRSGRGFRVRWRELPDCDRLFRPDRRAGNARVQTSLAY